MMEYTLIEIKSALLKSCGTSPECLDPGSSDHGVRVMFWEPYTNTNVNKLEMVQRRAIRFVKGGRL